MPALAATNLGKAYRTYRRPIDSLKELVFRRNYAETFWAIRGVNLEVPAGGSLGIVGDNGAGKTTLLKLLTGATAASEGAVQRQGRASAILSLGAGFHADLTGRENIRIGCAVLGLTPQETDQLLPGITEFSELGEFVERPLKTYSSGMYLRLAFSVATAIDPDILIVDEHLAVGDQHFRHKCLRRIMALREQGCALVFCTHDFYALGEVCDRAAWIERGAVAMTGPTVDVLRVYQEHTRAKQGYEAEAASVRRPAASAERDQDNGLIDVRLHGDVDRGVILSGGLLKVEIVARLTPSAASEGVHVGVLLIRSDGLWCYGVSSGMDGLVDTLQPLGGGRYAATLVFEALPLLAGSYSFTIALMDAGSPHLYDTRSGAAPFVVTHESKEEGVMRIPHHWERTVPADS